MKNVLTALACLLSVSLSAQEQVITYPYNPDADTDSLIAVPDMLDLLVLFGSEFIPEPVTVDGVVITEWLENNSNSSGGGGCDWQFPDGLNGEVVSVDMTQGNYTVPNGKNLYILNAYCNSGNTLIDLDGKNFIKYNDIMLTNSGGNPMAGSATTLSVHSNTSNPTSNMLYGLLVNKVVDFIAIDMLQSNYTVPDGKNLYILNAYCNVGNSLIDLDGKNFIKYNDPSFSGFSSNDVSIVGSGSTLSVSSVPGDADHNTIYGYLADEDYFADCGGGGGSSEGGVINNLGFGEFEDITSQINDNLTNTTPHPVFQQNEDGFLYIYLNPGNEWFNLSVDSISPLGFDFMSMYGSGKNYYQNTLGVTPIIFPIKKDYFWSFSAHPNVTAWKAFWIPLSSESSDSNEGDTENTDQTSISYVDFSQEVTTVELGMEDLTDMIICRLNGNVSPGTNFSLELPTENILTGHSVKILNDGLNGQSSIGLQLSPIMGNDGQVKNGYLGNWTFYNGNWYTIYEPD